MQTNNTYVKTEKTNKEARKQAQKANGKVKYEGKTWKRGNDKRGNLE